MDVSPEVITDGQQMCEKMIHIANPQSTREMEIKTKRPYFLTSMRKIPLLLSRYSRVRLFRDPMDCSPPGPPVHGIFQAGVLEWVAISFSTERYYQEKKKKAKNNKGWGRWGEIGTLLQFVRL